MTAVALQKLPLLQWNMAAAVSLFIRHTELLLLSATRGGIGGIVSDVGSPCYAVASALFDLTCVVNMLW